MKKTTVIITFFLTTFCSFGQTSNLNCKTLKFGDFVADKPQDSIYIFRDFSSWYEMNTTKGFRNIFTIIWKNDCDFTLVFKDCSSKEKAFNTYQKGDTLLYKTISLSDSSITFSVTNKLKTYEQTLSRQNRLDVWEYMLSRDEKLNEDSTFNGGISELFPDSIRRERTKLIQQIKKSTFNQTEVEQLEYVLTLLKQNNIIPIYTIASADFKILVPNTVLADYNDYIKNTYGKLESYSVFSSPFSMDWGNSFGGKKFNIVRKYLLDATFEKIKGNVQISVSFKYDSIYKIQSLNIQTSKTTEIPFIVNLTENFWSNLKDKKFYEIYNASAQLFKDNTTYEQIKNLLSLIESYGKLEYYKLSEQNFSIDDGKGYITTQYLMEKNNKKGIVILNFINENGVYKLAGLNYNQK